MRGWLFIKSITPDILPISIDRGFSSFSPRIFFFFFLPSFSFRGFAPFGFGDLVLRTRDGVRFPRGWSFFSFGREREILIVNWMISLLKSLDLESSRILEGDLGGNRLLLERGRREWLGFSFCIERPSENRSRNAYTRTVPLRRALIN